VRLAPIALTPYRSDKAGLETSTLSFNIRGQPKGRQVCLTIPLKLRESSAHLVVYIMRRVVCDAQRRASSVFRLIFFRCFNMTISRPDLGE
jgi:hypothetical protein